MTEPLNETRTPRRANPRRTNPRRTHRRQFVRAVVPLGLAAAALWLSGCGYLTVQAKVENATMTVSGSVYSETIALRLRAGDPNTVEVDVGADGTAEFSFDRHTFTTVNVNGGDGDDILRIDQTNGVFTDVEQTTLMGGPGNDTLTGASGSETLDGGAGADFLDGNQQIDTIAGGDGADTIQWDPGDSSDVIDGGADTDALAFNGANIAELFDVSANGGRVRFTRNIANIVMDLDNLETIDLRSVGGADVLNVSNLTGTDLTAMNVDMAASGGGDDAAIDEVTVPSGTTVSQDGTAGTVDGLGAQVRVTNGAVSDVIHVVGTAGTDTESIRGTDSADTVNVTADGTDVAVSSATPGLFVRTTATEHLDIDLGAGTDSFGTAGNLAPLVTLDVDGGTEADSIRGGNGADTIHGGAGSDVLDGNQGTDTISGDDGDDTVQWDPGDGNDTIDGNTGTDHLAFNGSNIGELFDLAANGDRVRFTRNVGNITQDADGVEVIDLRSVGGADILNVTNMTGTDLTTMNVDMAASGGGDDAAIDEVTVPTGTTVGQNGTAATVDGLGAQVRVTNGAVDDVIHVVGTPGTDTESIRGTNNADTVSVTADGTDVAVSGATPVLFVRTTATERVDIDLGAGTDTFGAAGNLAPLVTLDIDGGTEADNLRGGNGADTIHGGAGSDVLDGNQGTDTISGDDGDDTVQWDPGDGNDTVDGNTGTDHLAFNGSAIGELLDITANGSRVRLTRNIGAVAQDLDNIETIDLRTLAGTDTVTVNNVAGTDLTTVNVDLTASVGGADLSADQVTVNGTAGDDAISVSDEASAVLTQGLPAVVRITGTDPTLDRLTVNGLAGTDSITTTPGAGALILLDLLP